MPIDSLEELHAFAAELIEQAKTHLVDDDDLSPTALLFSKSKQIEMDTDVPELFLNGLMRQFVKQDPEMECAAYITLGIAAKTNGLKPEADPRDDPNHYYVIIAHVSHRDFGALAAIVPVVREAPKKFRFKEIAWSKVIAQHSVLDHLWAKRQLNS
jgi:hypothetical protein